jgi:signal transduction histidine kinase/ActR/RegA family two-component response regulator
MPRLRDIPLRLKIALILVLGCALGDLAFVIFWQPHFVARLIAQERQESQQHLVTVGDAVTPFLVQNQLAAIYEILNTTLERRATWRAITLKDESGLTIYPLDPPELDNPDDLETLTHTVSLRGESLGQIALQADFSASRKEHQREALTLLLAFTIGILALAIMIGLFLDFTVSKRLRYLARASGRLAQGDFEAPLPIHCKDEIGQLSSAFKEMRNNIKAKEEVLIVAREAAEAGNRAKSAFLANMSHEIRTPLNAILGFAQIGERTSHGEEDKENYTYILRAGEQLLRVINDVLDFSKIEAGKLDVEEIPFSLADLVADVRHVVAPLAQAKGLALSMGLAADLPPRVNGDPLRIQQILANLLSNAVKFTPEGKVALQVTAEDGMVLFRVSDTGIGMTPDALAKVFNAFEQADTSTTRKFGGTGLGLTLSRDLARLMGGNITARSESGKGSVFTLALPLPDASETASHDAATAQHHATGPRLTGLRLLAAEDMETNRAILEAMMRQEGADLASVENGKQAVDMLQKNGPKAFDAVLMDVQMPTMDGLEAARRIREFAPELPIIGLTAHATLEDHDRALEAGMVGYITKPIDTDALVAAILAHTTPMEAGLSA